MKQKQHSTEEIIRIGIDPILVETAQAPTVTY